MIRSIFYNDDCQYELATFKIEAVPRVGEEVKVRPYYGQTITGIVKNVVYTFGNLHFVEIYLTVE